MPQNRGLDLCKMTMAQRLTIQLFIMHIDNKKQLAGQILASCIFVVGCCRAPCLLVLAGCVRGRRRFRLLVPGDLSGNSGAE